MAKIQISKGNEINYEEQYSIDIRTSKILTAEEYQTIIDSIESISTLLDPYIEVMRENKKLELKK